MNNARVQITHSSFLPAGLLILALITAGCTSTKVVPHPGAAEYADTDPSRVQLLPWAPVRSYERVGEVILEPSPSTPWQQVDEELRAAAADLGGHAMYIVWDPTKRYSVVQVDPVTTDHRDHYPPNGIVAVVIRFL